MFRSKLFAVSAASLIGVLSSQESQAQWPDYNPVVGASNRYFNGSYWNPYTGRYVVRTNQDVVHASATDPYRNDVMPGTLRYVNYYERDAYGRLVQVTGWTWTSINGTPHSTLRRTVRQFSGYTSGYTPGGGLIGISPVVEHQSTTHFYKAKAK